MNVLVIAPHPDDELIGCAGTIRKHVENGDSVYVCIATIGHFNEFRIDLIKRTREEDFNALNDLGVDDVFYLDLFANSLSAIKQAQINEPVSNVVAKVRPDVAYIPFRGDIHYDHKAVADSALVALRPKFGVKPCKIYAYEVPSETGWDAPYIQNAFIPNSYVDISSQIEAKKSALRMVSSQIPETADARSVESLVALAKHRGSTVGVAYAEAFMLIREIV